MKRFEVKITCVGTAYVTVDAETAEEAKAKVEGTGDDLFWLDFTYDNFKAEKAEEVRE